MADDDQAQDTGPSNAELAGRVDGLESKLDLVLEKLGGVRSDAHAAAQQHTEERLDRPSTIAEEIRAQLDAQRAADADAASKQSSADRLAAVEERLSGMQEKTPETPPRRVEKIFGWR